MMGILSAIDGRLWPDGIAVSVLVPVSPLALRVEGQSGIWQSAGTGRSTPVDAGWRSQQLTDPPQQDLVGAQRSCAAEWGELAAVTQQAPSQSGVVIPPMARELKRNSTTSVNPAAFVQ